MKSFEVLEQITNKTSVYYLEKRMSDSAQEDSDKALVQLLVKGFHEYFSKHPPLTEGSRYILPDALITVPLYL